MLNKKCNLSRNNEIFFKKIAEKLNQPLQILISKLLNKKAQITGQ